MSSRNHRFYRRDNPKHLYHDTYQTSVTRWISFLITRAVASLFVDTFGLVAVGHFLAMVITLVTGSIVVGFFCVLLHQWLLNHND